FAPDRREELTEAVSKVFAARHPFRAFAKVNLSKTGGTVHLETRGVPILDAAGNLRGYRGADTDVSISKRADELLRSCYLEVEEENERLQAERDYLEKTVSIRHTLGVVGESPAIQKVIA